ncbi:MAG: hypothetical protein A2X23_13655 [Chloroflexi bacterium GWC2_73_18]|nr:MAG: hypothetical protein A2X23_13655 [Chloroflexi bacterium GWC2_73_18]
MMIGVEPEKEARRRWPASATADAVQTGTEVIVRFGGDVRFGRGAGPGASAAPSGPIGTASAVTVVP